MLGTYDPSLTTVSVSVLPPLATIIGIHQPRSSSTDGIWTDIEKVLRSVTQPWSGSNFVGFS